MKRLTEREHEHSTRKRLDADRVQEHAALKDPIETTLAPVESRGRDLCGLPRQAARHPGLPC